ncbi:hypothetical protein TNCV_3553331 [Trichonephila clavipes]|nr:hypothetical protein TNCV_3553331 [Trichonephila clavipes]
MKAYTPICYKRVYTVCLETVVTWLQIADETGRMLCSIGLFLQLLTDSSLPLALYLGLACILTSTDISVTLELLSKPRDDNLGNSKFFRYYHLSTSTYHAADNFTKRDALLSIRDGNPLLAKVRPLFPKKVQPCVSRDSNPNPLGCHPSGIVVREADYGAVGFGFESRVKQGCLHCNSSLLCDGCFTLTSMRSLVCYFVVQGVISVLKKRTHLGVTSQASYLPYWLGGKQRSIHTKIYMGDQLG